ncbi:MAG TPA: S9 family peptidase [Opitutaceae bacterium]|nr:S9 family peptidase [Opitutaceae bacterium]
MQTARRLAILLGALCAVVAAFAARPLVFDDLMKLHRVSDPQLSPDGQWVAFTVSDVVYDENRTNSDIWVAPTSGGEPRKVTNSPKADNHPRWSPDGQWLAFVSTRDGESQVWLLPMAGQGGEARKLTSIATGASQPVWSPSGDKLAFVSSVYPEFSAKPFAEADRLNREKDEGREKSKVKAKVFTQLLYRHWDSWVDDKRQHLFVVGVKDGAAVGEPRNVTPGDNDAVPTSSTFSEGDDFAFSPDGKTLVYTAPHAVVREQAWRTNHDLWSVDLATGDKRQLTTSPAADTYPRFSPDGKLLAYRAQARPGFEADKWELRVLSFASGENWSATKDADLSSGAFIWAPDGQSLVFDAQDKGTMAIWTVPSAGGAPKPVAQGGYNAEMNVAADKRFMVFTHSRATQPAEVMIHRFDTGVTAPLTRLNRGLLDDVALTPLESVTVPGAGDTPVQMWILRPPGFDPAKKYPLVFWVHGGPQGAFMDVWGYRWNPQLWAAQGYVVAMPNPRGSTGFGQKFTDEISMDWGGKVFDDLMAALGHLEKQPWIDTSRMAAAGASYGGYMMNWFQGHTDKFKTLVTHCGVFNLTSMYGVTEETWFAEWDTGVPWETPDYEKWSPHKYAAKFKTPNLIIHNELDFRVPIGEGLQLFTVLQRRGVPSKLLYFPDEGHWVNKPQNSALWHSTIFDWLGEYLKK